MPECRWSKRVERWFDGESREPDSVARHLAGCSACAAYVARLERFRAGVRAVSVRPEVSASQMPAFLEGIRERIEAPRRRRSGWWAVVSLTAAAMLVAVSLFALVTGGPDPVKAEHSVIESATTDVEGATVETKDSTEGNRAIVWVHVPRKDVL